MNRKITHTLPCMLLLTFLLGSCMLHDTAGPEQKAGKVVLFYMGGDNNLSAEVEQKTDALMQGWNPKEGDKLLIFADKAGEGAVLFEIKNRNGRNYRDDVKKYGDVNSASAVMLAQAIDDVTGRYAADSYGLMVFSHASGWLPAGALENPLGVQVDVEDWNPKDIPVQLGGTRTIIVDGKSEMNIKEFANAIPYDTFDFIIFEACMMSGIEVMYELKDKASYILASSAEILSPGFTDAYARYADMIFAGDLEGFAKEVYGMFDGKEGYERSATLSLVNTGALDGLAAWIKANADTSAGVDVNSVQCFNRTRYPLVFDFYDYFSRLVPDGMQDELARLVGECVVWKAATPDFLRTHNGFSIDQHSGLTTYIPRDGFEALNTIYTGLSWCSEGLD